MTEEQTHKQVAEFIKLTYPNIVFNTDMSGIKLTIGQATKASKLRSKDKFPDIVIYKQMNGFAGLFIELKKDGVKLFNKKGEYATEHIEAQSSTLRRLNHEGYKAVFAVGYDEAISIIDDYLR